MGWLVLGVLLFAGVHAVPAALSGPRGAVVGRIGEPAYKGLFSLGVLAGIGLMVVGWRSAAPGFVYSPPAWGHLAAIPLVFLALVLFVASGVPTNLKRLLRHPQLTGVATWAGAHLLANGDLRSVLLFGGLGAWAIVEMLLLNRRDGPWLRPEPQPPSAELKPAVGAVVAFAVLYLLHPYFAGMPVVVR